MIARLCSCDFARFKRTSLVKSAGQAPSQIPEADHKDRISHGPSAAAERLTHFCTKPLGRLFSTLRRAVDEGRIVTSRIRCCAVASDCDPATVSSRPISWGQDFWPSVFTDFSARIDAIGFDPPCRVRDPMNRVGNTDRIQVWERMFLGNEPHRPPFGATKPKVVTDQRACELARLDLVTS